MREKRLKYILIPIVLSIWAYAVYKYFIESPDAKGGGPVLVADESLPGGDVAAGPGAADSFGLLGGYRDPFLGKDRFVPPPPAEEFAGPQTSSGGSSFTLPGAKPEEAVAEPNWRRFRYLGMLQETGKAEPYGIVVVDGRSQTLPAGGSAKGLQVLWLTADSVGISYDAFTQTLHRR